MCGHNTSGLTRRASLKVNDDLRYFILIHEK